MKDYSNHSATMREWLVRQVAPDQRRLDLFLHTRLPELSRRSLQELFSAGKIRRNRRIAAKGDRIKDGDRITIDLPVHWEALPLADPAVPVCVVYEDPDLLIVDKPGSIPSHPLRAWGKGTLANGLAARFPELGGRGPRALEAGLIHRLDTGTSGLLVAARNAEVRTRLKQDLARRRWEKRYLALVRGAVVGEEKITVPLAHHPGDRKKMIGVSDRGAQQRGRVYRAETRIRSRQQWPGVSLIEAELITGVTHQIRVHLSDCGHPVIGDRLYGPADDPFPNLPEGRHFLHAWSIALPHPLTRERLVCTSSLPADLQRVLDSLGPPLA